MQILGRVHQKKTSDLKRSGEEELQSQLQKNPRQTKQVLDDSQVQNRNKTRKGEAISTDVATGNAVAMPANEEESNNGAPPKSRSWEL